MVIRPDDRVSKVIARDERLIDEFTSLSPVFERLRNPAMRKIMTRLVTVEQAARMAGVDPAELVDRLNRAIGGGSLEAGSEGRNEGTASPPSDDNGIEATGSALSATEVVGQGLPAVLRDLPPERLVDLDVREDLRAGREPFSTIMAARRSLPEGGVLRLRAIFEPVPLYAVMAKQGLAHWTERLAEDDWRVWFYPADLKGASVDAAPPRGQGEPETGGDDVVILDVRGLEPPEPMMRTLEAVEGLPPGATLVQLNVRVPRFLLPLLEERGFTYEIREEATDVVRLFIRRRADA